MRDFDRTLAEAEAEMKAVIATCDRLARFTDENSPRGRRVRHIAKELRVALAEVAAITGEHQEWLESVGLDALDQQLDEHENRGQS